MHQAKTCAAIDIQDILQYLGSSWASSKMCWCIKAQLVRQLTSKTSSYIKCHLEHPYKFLGASRHNLCNYRQPRHPPTLRVILSIHIYKSLGASRHNFCNNRHPDASRVILIIHINALVHVSKMYASMKLHLSCCFVGHLGHP